MCWDSKTDGNSFYLNRSLIHSLPLIMEEYSKLFKIESSGNSSRGSLHCYGVLHRKIPLCSEETSQTQRSDGLWLAPV
jgi:hypothetical protein